MRDESYLMVNVTFKRRSGQLIIYKIIANIRLFKIVLIILIKCA